MVKGKASVEAHAAMNSIACKKEREKIKKSKNLFQTLLDKKLTSQGRLIWSRDEECHPSRGLRN